jgi:DNA-binding MarR family transcriptional regulator
VAEPREILEQARAREVFSALHRLTIMLLLYLHKKVGFTELQKLLQLTPGNLDHHLRKLEQVGYIKTRKKLSWRPLIVVEITREGAEALRDYAITLRKLLETIK